MFTLVAEIFTSSTAQATFSAPTTPLQDVIAFFKNNVYKPSGRFTKGLGNGDESSSSGEEEHEEDWDTDDFEGEESEVRRNPIETKQNPTSILTLTPTTV